MKQRNFNPETVRVGDVLVPRDAKHASMGLRIVMADLGDRLLRVGPFPSWFMPASGSRRGSVRTVNRNYLGMTYARIATEEEKERWLAEHPEPKKKAKKIRVETKAPEPVDCMVRVERMLARICEELGVDV